MEMTTEQWKGRNPPDQMCLMPVHLHSGGFCPPPSVVSVLLAAAYQQRGETFHRGERPFKLLS